MRLNPKRRTSTGRCLFRANRVACGLAVLTTCIGVATNGWAEEFAFAQRQIQVDAGQVQIAPAGQGPAADGQDQANTGGVFVRDSAVAGEKLALAERMERLGEWDTSAEVYQEVLDKYADRVLPIHFDSEGRPDRYGSVTVVVQGRIARWPEAGRQIYQGRYDLPARQMLESLDRSNRGDLTKVVSRYFVTSAGREAALLLIESYFDHAEFIAAAMLSDRLLDQHPLVNDDRALLLTRSALSWHLAGEASRASERGKQLAAQHPDAVASIGGKEQNLSALVTSALATPRHVQAARSNSNWPVPFGSNDRSAVAFESRSANESHQWVRIDSIPIRPTLTNLNPNDMRGVEPILQRQRDLGAMTGILPSVDGSQMFFQDNASVYAYDLDRGTPLAGWLDTHPADGRYKIEATTTPRSKQMTTTLTANRVLAILGQQDAMSMASGLVVPTRVVCLDRETGRLQWSITPTDFQTDDESLRAAQPCGSVLVVGDAVYVVARSQRSGTFQDSYLICLSLADGSLRWSRHLASGNSTRAMFDPSMPVVGDNDSHLAYADGRIFISTDIGALACVDAADGSLAWLSIYPRPLPVSNQNWVIARRNMKVEPSFAGNPILLHDGKLISMPSDSESLFIHDAATGETVSRVSITYRDQEEGASGALQPAQKFKTLIGVNEKFVYLAGSRSIALLDLSKLQGDRTFAEALDYARPLQRGEFVDDTLRGRPFLTDKSLYVMTAWKLFRMSLDGRRALEMYPLMQETLAAQNEEPGNILLVDGTLILAGPKHVNVYAELPLLRARMESAINDGAQSVIPRLRYAEALFNTGQFEESIQWIDTAIAQLTVNNLITPGRDRDRIFDLSMQMLRRLARRNEGNADLLKPLLERAVRTADLPAQQLSYQLARAFASRRLGDHADAIDAYQRLIDDPVLSQLRVSRGADSFSVRDVAVKSIDEVVGESGVDAYRLIETRAQSALAEARDSNDARQLLAVLDKYPNSRAGDEAATLAMNSALANAGSTSDLLRRVGSMLNNPAMRNTLYESLIKIELQNGRLDAALGRARRVAKHDPDRPAPSVSFAGEPVAAQTASEMVRALQALAFDAQDARLADMKIAEAEPIFDLDRVVNTPQISTIMLPATPRRDMVVAMGRDRAIKLIAPGNPTPLKSIVVPEITDLSPVLWNGDQLLLTNSMRLSAVDAIAGRLMWTLDPADVKPPQAISGGILAIDDLGLINPEPAETNAETEGDQGIEITERIINNRRIRQQVIRGQGGIWQGDPHDQRLRENVAYTRAAGDVIVIVTSRGRVIGVDAKAGHVRWQTTFSDRSPSMVGQYGDQIVLGGNDDNGSNLLILQSGDGRELLRRKFTGSPGARMNTLAVSSEGYLALVQADAIQLIDLGSGSFEPVATVTGKQLNAPMLFEATSQGGQVQFCGDRLLVTVGTIGTQQVRMFDLLTLEPIRVTDDRTRQRVERNFVPNVPGGQRQNDQVQMIVHRDRLLLRTGRAMTVYGVLMPDAYPWSLADVGNPAITLNSQSPLLVNGGVMIARWPADMLLQTAPAPIIEFYKRTTQPDGREVAMVLTEFTLKRPNARMQDKIQAVNGGFYTVWSDGVLQFIPGVNAGK